MASAVGRARSNPGAQGTGDASDVTTSSTAAIPLWTATSGLDTAAEAATASLSLASVLSGALLKQDSTALHRAVQ
jgi:hypothetical protein